MIFFNASTAVTFSGWPELWPSPWPGAPSIIGSLISDTWLLRCFWNTIDIAADGDYRFAEPHLAVRR